MDKLDLQVTERVRAHVELLLQSHEAGSLPALFFGSSRTYSSTGELINDAPPHWRLNVYSKAQVEQLSRDYLALGHELVYRANDLVVCVPQTHLVASLSGRTLDLEANAVCVR